MRINKDIEIALKALTILKTGPGIVKASDIAYKIHESQNFVEQIMLRLKRFGIVEVKRGPGGGYLASFKTHSALEVAKALDYTFEVVGEPNTPEYILSLALIKAFENTHI